jgi:hypothetical protein
LQQVQRIYPTSVQVIPANQFNPVELNELIRTGRAQLATTLPVGVTSQPIQSRVAFTQPAEYSQYQTISGASIPLAGSQVVPMITQEQLHQLRMSSQLQALQLTPAGVIGASGMQMGVHRAPSSQGINVGAVPFIPKSI